MNTIEAGHNLIAECLGLSAGEQSLFFELCGMKVENVASAVPRDLLFIETL
jgi:hypothetical protein